MKVKELLALLHTLDQEMPVVCARYSDHQDLEMPTVELAFRRGFATGSDGRPLQLWERFYPRQWETGPPEKRPSVEAVLRFDGN